MVELIPVHEAWSIIQSCSPLQDNTKRVSTDAALGLTTAEEIKARYDQPPFANSAMDGFAVRAKVVHVGGRLNVVGEVAAGAKDTGVDVGDDECVRIMTGGPLPNWANAVIPKEWVDEQGGIITVQREVMENQHCRPRGDDLGSGTQVIAAGTRLGPHELGLVAYAGHGSVLVYQKPSIGIITTGNELKAAGGELTPGEIFDSNGPTLAGLCKQAGASVVSQVRARDSRASLEGCLRQSQSADILIFSGGVSVGKYDFVKEVLEGNGFEILFWRVRQRPGKPLLFGRSKKQVVFGLPGNPVSSALCFDQYVRYSIALRLGRDDAKRPEVPAVLRGDVQTHESLHYFLRGVQEVDGSGVSSVRIIGKQGSHIFSSLRDANCIVHVPEGVSEVKDGTIVATECF